MAAGKFKLSETLKILTNQFNAITHQEIFLSLEMEERSLQAGQALSARAVVRSPGEARTIDYLTLNLQGQVQRDGKWRDYTEGAEVAQGVALEADQELIIPVVILVPEDAVLSEDGGTWSLTARVVLNGAIDPRDELVFEVVSP